MPIIECPNCGRRVLSKADGTCPDCGFKDPTAPPPAPAAGPIIMQGPVFHERLSDLQLQRLAELQRVFAEVDPTPLEGWIENFKRDRDPDRQIESFEAMAKPFEEFASRPEVTQAMKEEAFTLLLLRSLSRPSTEEVLSAVNIRALTREQAREILDGFTLESRPIIIKPVDQGDVDLS